METHVKERLTGALILVALLVIVVPEILPGPDGDAGRSGRPAAAADGPPLRTYTMELGAAGDAAASDQSALAPQSGVTPGGPDQAAGAAASGKPEATPAPVAAATDAPATVESRGESAPAATSAPAPVPAAVNETPAPAGSWWVQVGSFSQSANAQRLVRTLAAAGFRAQVSSVTQSGKELFRVRAGPVSDRPSAQALKERLAAAGHKGSLVAP